MKLYKLPLLTLLLATLLIFAFFGCKKEELTISQLSSSTVVGSTTSTNITDLSCCVADYESTKTILFACGDLKVTAQNNGTSISVNINRSGADPSDHFTQVDYLFYGASGPTGPLLTDNSSERKDLTLTYDLPENWQSCDGYNVHLIIKGLGGLDMPGCDLLPDEINSGRGKLELTKPITVHALTPPTPSEITGLSSVCVGSSIQLTELTSGGSWSSSNDAIATVSSSGSVAGIADGVAIIKYTVTNTQGCSNYIEKTITVNAKPTVSVSSSSASICLGQTTATLTASGATSYNWSPTSGLSSAAGATVIANPATTTTYTVTGTNVNGCTNSATITVTVNVCVCQGLRTQSLGYWKSSNKNGSLLLGTSWVGAITIGCGANIKIFANQTTLQAAITNNLGTPSKFPNLSTFSAQLLALSINLKMWPAIANTKIIIAGPFAGMSVSDVLKLANDVFGGCNNNFTPSQMTEILDKINNSYDGGKYNGIPTISCSGITPST